MTALLDFQCCWRHRLKILRAVADNALHFFYKDLYFYVLPSHGSELHLDVLYQALKRLLNILSRLQHVRIRLQHATALPDFQRCWRYRLKILNAVADSALQIRTFMYFCLPWAWAAPGRVVPSSKEAARYFIHRLYKYVRIRLQHARTGGNTLEQATTCPDAACSNRQQHVRLQHAQTGCNIMLHFVTTSHFYGLVHCRKSLIFVALSPTVVCKAIWGRERLSRVGRKVKNGGGGDWSMDRLSWALAD